MKDMIEPRALPGRNWPSGFGPSPVIGAFRRWWQARSWDLAERQVARNANRLAEARRRLIEENGDFVG